MVQRNRGMYPQHEPSLVRACEYCVRITADCAARLGSDCLLFFCGQIFVECCDKLFD